MKTRTLLFAPEMLLHLTSGRFEVVAHPAPADARVVAAGYDTERRAIYIDVESATFHKEDPDLLDPPVIHRVGEAGTILGSSPEKPLAGNDDPGCSLVRRNP